MTGADSTESVKSGSGADVNAAGPIRADLGRPETPEERDARMRENSRLHRQRQTVTNLIYALVVSLGIVLVLVLIVPRNDKPRDFSVDNAQVAAEAQPQYTTHLAVPSLPEGWVSNGAEIRRSPDGVTEWYTGFVVNEGDKPVGFAAVSQGINANDTWVLGKLEGRRPTGEISLGGLSWVEYDYTTLAPEDAGNTRYSLVAKDGDSTYVIYGSHAPEQVQQLASAVAAARG